jgi:hypothetical protein
MRDWQLPKLVPALAVAIVILSPRVIPTARLAWYDSTMLHEAYLVATTDDGNRARVPSNYFLSASLPMAQMRFSFGLLGRLVPTGIYGATWTYDDMRKANSCELPLRSSRGAEAANTWGRFERFVREHHAYVLASVNGNGRLDYDWYPHHIWSNPLLYEDFSAMDKRRIIEYQFVIDYVCLGYDEGRLQRRVLGTDSRRIPVPGPQRPEVAR